jgi:CBS domain-containing protein
MDRTVAEVVAAEFTDVSPATKLSRVSQLMVEHHISSIPVITSERRLVGIVSRQDVMRALPVCCRASPRQGQ